MPKGKCGTDNRLRVNRRALKSFELVAVTYSYVEREYFPSEEAYQAELEVEGRARQVVAALEKLGVPAKAYPGNQYLVPTLMVDQPDLVLNLVDSLRGRDALQTSVPAALELSEIPYTGASMLGLVIGNNRDLTKQLLRAFDIPTPAFQFISRAGVKVDEDLDLPLIVKLNESGGSVGIDNAAVKETVEDAQEQVERMMSTYKMPVIVERFVDGRELTVVVFDDGQKKHVFIGEKEFHLKPDGKHEFTSRESYEDARAYTYRCLADEDLAERVRRYAVRAFNGLHFRDYGKFDVRVGEETCTPYFTDCNPNTAFGPDLGLPFTEVLALHGVKFEDALVNLLGRYAKKSR